MTCFKLPQTNNVALELPFTAVLMSAATVKKGVFWAQWRLRVGNK
jgi:hypothetical protein